jgi:AraC-like DNA-binding protein
MIVAHRPDGVPGVDLQTGTGIFGDCPRHWHEDYHLCFHTGGYGALRYRGTSWPNPPGSLNLVEPGEVHSNTADRPRGCDFLKLDFDPAWFRAVSDQVASADDIPAFAQPTTFESATVQSFVRLHRTLTNGADRIEKQSELLSFLAMLLQRHQRTRATLRPAGRDARAVRLVKDFLIENYREKVDLAQLSALTGLSPFHLTRVFAREAGMPPHAFLNQVRIARAKTMLRRGAPIARVALETGFADQSHFTRTFRRMVQIPPGAYLKATPPAAATGSTVRLAMTAF